MIAGGIKRIFQMVHLQPRGLHDLKKSESSVNHLDGRIFEKCSSHVIIFESCMVSVFSFLLITISNHKKRTRVKKNIWWIKLQMIEL